MRSHSIFLLFSCLFSSVVKCADAPQGLFKTVVAYGYVNQDGQIEFDLGSLYDRSELPACESSSGSGYEGEDQFSVSENIAQEGGGDQTHLTNPAQKPQSIPLERSERVLFREACFDSGRAHAVYLDNIPRVDQQDDLSVVDVTISQEQFRAIVAKQVAEEISKGEENKSRGNTGCCSCACKFALLNCIFS